MLIVILLVLFLFSPQCLEKHALLLQLKKSKLKGFLFTSKSKET